MKKVFVLFVAVLVTAPAFAQQKPKDGLAAAFGGIAGLSKADPEFVARAAARVATVGAELQALKSCLEEKEAFERDVATQKNKSFIVQNILINMADPMERMSDEKALPLAMCYNNYKVKGAKMTQFVRSNATIFSGDVSGREAQNLRNFAGRVEALSNKVAFDKMAKQDNDYFIAQNILINLAEPLAKLSDAEAAPMAKVYATFEVKGTPMVNFAQEQAQKYDEFEALRAFASRINELAK